ncbi:MAG: hypothetical protein LBV43_09190 [Prevotella sp.]|jgi:hypothetical protein|nr:hypothetical protein [Prevotella sp.]
MHHSSIVRKTVTVLLVFLFFVLNLFSQDWQQQGSYFIRMDGNTFFSIDSVISTTIGISQREGLVAKTKQYIRNNLDLLNETDFNEPLAIAFMHSRGELYRHTGKRVSSFNILKDSTVKFNQVMVIYDPEYCPLNRELIKIIVSSKWGKQKDNQLLWLKEGLATYVSPETDSCDGLNLEENIPTCYKMKN